MIDSPVCLDPMKEASVDQTQEAPCPNAPPDLLSVIDVPGQIVVPAPVIPVGCEDAPGGVEQLRHCDPSHAPDVQLTAVGVLQEPLTQVD